MKYEAIGMLILSFIGCVGGLLLAFETVSMHEDLHESLYADFGYNSTTELHLFGRSTCQAQPIAPDDFLPLEYVHAMNDAVFYNTALPLTMICVILSLIWLTLLVKR